MPLKCDDGIRTIPEARPCFLIRPKLCMLILLTGHTEVERAHIMEAQAGMMVNLVKGLKVCVSKELVGKCNNDNS